MAAALIDDWSLADIGVAEQHQVDVSELRGLDDWSDQLTLILMLPLCLTVHRRHGLTVQLMAAALNDDWSLADIGVAEQHQIDISELRPMHNVTTSSSLWTCVMSSLHAR